MCAVLVTHIPQVMTHYPSTHTVSSRYFTGMIKSSSHTCFITLNHKLMPIFAFMTNLKL